MMRLALAAGLLAIAVAGCRTADRDEMKTLEARLNANLEKKVAEVERKILDVDKKLTGLLQIQQKIDRAAAEMERHSGHLQSANQRLILMLETQQRVLKEQLATINALIEELKR